MSQRKLDRPYGKSWFHKSTARKPLWTRLGPPLAAQIEFLEDRTLLATSLGAAETFAVLAHTTVTNSGPSIITGDLGLSTGTSVTGFPPGIVSPPFAIHAGTDAVAAAARADLTTAYLAIAGYPVPLGHDLTGQNLAGLTLTPGVYSFSSEALLTTGAVPTLTLDFLGNPNAEFDFQIGSKLTTGPNALVKVINGGDPCNVFWQVGSSAKLDTNTVFLGHILALTDINVLTGATILVGSALARNGQVTLDTNSISVADCLAKGSISGQKFDVGNGTQHLGGLAGLTVFLDTNNNGVLDTGERSTITDVNGNFSFPNLLPGTYIVREVQKPGLLQTTPNPAPITLASGQTVPGINFGDFRLITIGGTKFEDLNGSGIRNAGDPGLAGVTIFLDLNHDGKLDPGDPSTVTDANGNFSFSNVGPGTYIVREVQQPGFTQTTVNPGNIVSISGTNVAGVDFGNFHLITISGAKFEDMNGSGIRTAGDPGLAGVTIFLDSNNNGILDTGERSTITDASGNFSFSNLAPGTYHVREVQQAGFTQTTVNPATIVAQSGVNVAGVAFGNFHLITISGAKFQDTNGDGIRNAVEPGLAGVTIFIDANLNGILDTGERSTVTDANGNFSFANLGLGTFRVREVGQPNFVQMTNNPADIIVTTSGANVTGTLFGNIPAADLFGVSKLALTGQNLSNLLDGTFARQANFVANLFETSLGRAPDLAGLTFYLRLLMAGFTEQQVAAMFNVNGLYAVSNPGSITPFTAGSKPFTLASITQVGDTLTLVNGTTSTTANFMSTTQLQVTTTGSNTATATFADGTMTFSNNGQVWTKLDLPANFISSSGGPAHVIQNGTNSLVFVNNLGQSSPGFWTSPTQVIATGFGNQVGTVGNGMILWSTGEVWSENLVLRGNNSSPGTTIAGMTTISTGTSITVNDYLIGGRTAHVVQTGTNDLVFINEKGNIVLGNWINATQAIVPAWGNDVATFSAGKISFSDHSLWNLTTSATPQITVTDYTISGLTAYVIQNGTQALAFVNEKGNVVLGNWISPTRALVGPWGNDVATFGNGQIDWSDGSVWSQNAPVALPVTILDYVNMGNGLTAHVVQNGTNTVAFVNEWGNVVLGALNNATQATVGSWNNDVATFSNGKINWSDGAVWNLTTTPSASLFLTNYLNAGNGLKAHVIQNGTATAVFVNEFGTVVLGTMNNPAQATVADWHNDVATFSNGNINWSDGSVWNNLTTSAPLLVTLIDANGAVSHVQLLSRTTLIGRDGPLQGVNGTRQDDKIIFSNGTVWDSFNFNALNALFGITR